MIQRLAYFSSVSAPPPRVGYTSPQTLQPDTYHATSNDSGWMQMQALRRQASGSDELNLAALEIRQQVTRWTQQDPKGFGRHLRSSLGEPMDTAEGRQLEELCRRGQMPLPQKIRFVSDEILDGTASSYGQNTIYLNESLRAHPERLRTALGEEIGHHLLAQVGGEPGQGEGEAFQAGLAQQARPGQEQSSNLSRDSQERVTCVVYPDGTRRQFGYDQANQLDRMTGPDGVVWTREGNSNRWRSNRGQVWESEGRERVDPDGSYHYRNSMGDQISVSNDGKTTVRPSFRSASLAGFEKWDANGDRFLSKNEIEAALGQANLTNEQAAALTTMRDHHADLQAVSNDEWGAENDGIHRQDLLKAGGDTLKQVRARYEHQRHLTPEQQRTQEDHRAAQEELHALNVELAKTLAQAGVDVAGVFDPTPVSDAIGAGMALSDGDLIGAGLSLISMIPYAGDAVGKTAKAVRLADKLNDLRKRVARSSELVKSLGKRLDDLKSARKADAPAPHKVPKDPPKTPDGPPKTPNDPPKTPNDPPKTPNDPPKTPKKGPDALPDELRAQAKESLEQAQKQIDQLTGQRLPELNTQVNQARDHLAEAQRRFELEPAGPNKGKLGKEVGKAKDNLKQAQADLNRATQKLEDLRNVQKAAETLELAPAGGYKMNQQKWWDKNQGAATGQNSLDDHFRKHGDEFGHKNADEYLKYAQEYAQNPPPGTMVLKGPTTGSTVLFDPKTGTVGVYATAADGSLIPVTLHKANPAEHRLNSDFDYFLHSL